MKRIASWFAAGCLTLGVTCFTVPGLQAQANIDLIKQKAKGIKRDTESKQTNNPAAAKTNAPAGKPKPAPAKGKPAK